VFVVFKCTAGGSDGWGNILRLRIIFEKLKEKKKFSYLFIVNNNLALKKFLKKNKIKFKSFNSFEKEKKFIKNYKIDIAIIELLNCEKFIQKFYKSLSKKLVILDDIAKKKYISDILIICQKKKIINKNIKIFNDYKFFPLEKGYDFFLNKKILIKKKIKNITIFLGGGFYFKEYFKIAKILKDKEHDISFIIGQEVKKINLDKIQNLNNNFKIYISPKNIPEIIYKSDLVICGGGYTKIEAAYLAKPIIPVPIHRHQIELCKRFKKEFGINYILKSKLGSLLNKKIDSYNYKIRNNISKIFRKKFSKNGVNRIADIILNEK
jgi:spore coat polysaccharide biosynthesis predicted glycosyltransferase SpsG